MDKEREDSLKSETASSASSSCASIIRRKSDQGLEIQAKMEQLKADILKSQNASNVERYDIDDDIATKTKSSSERVQESMEVGKGPKSSASKVKQLTSRSFDNDSSSEDDNNERNTHSRRKTHNQNAKTVSSVGGRGMILTTQDRNYKAQGQGQGQDVSQLSNSRSSSNSIRNDAAGLRYREYDDGSLERSEDSVFGFDSIDRIDTDLDTYGVGAQGAGLTRTLSVGSSIQGSKDSGKSGGSLYGRLKRTIIKTVGGKKDSSESTPERDVSTSRVLMSAGSHSRLISSSGSYFGSKEDANSSVSERMGTPVLEKDSNAVRNTPDRPVSTSFLSLPSQKLNDQNK